MPPQIPGPRGLNSMTFCLRPTTRPSAASLQPLIQQACLSQKEKKRKAKQDPYRWNQAQQRKAANVKRQEELQKIRDAAWGSPIHGIMTPFVESFDSAGQAPVSIPRTDEDGNPLEKAHELPMSPHILNFLLSKSEWEEAIAASYQLTKPLEPTSRGTIDPVREEQEKRQHEERHARAVNALERLTKLENGSSKDRLHANIRRCIDTFGRHNTDPTLPQKPLARGQEKREPTPRAGPDTGSSEVQIAILTAKIRVLAKNWEGRKGSKDKFNRRNLRLLLHRRQKLLKYMERKERGSGRWTHLIETLGLSPATWKHQIEV
ncbi:Ribosomal protein S15-like protein [Pleurostoma richardsiae]|uniref:Ribosomal protein S15-like protein n=1 Tax=Pleurostoma richardsiae TaxID=41990 RepID=A0AA38S612_9PEZI|nr:Ribosomal protein S15-like protein [Pleurostoma richardsiae]